MRTMKPGNHRRCGAAHLALTANHYWLDGLVALTLLAFCLLLARARNGGHSEYGRGASVQSAADRARG